MRWITSGWPNTRPEHGSEPHRALSDESGTYTVIPALFFADNPSRPRGWGEVAPQQVTWLLRDTQAGVVAPGVECVRCHNQDQARFLRSFSKAFHCSSESLDRSR
jgi:hypothetical protein